MIIVAGFVSSGYLLNTSFSDWSEAPVITTLDSIAAPIRDLQFPTVTVCQNEERPPDRWAFIETILNLLAFECSPENDKVFNVILQRCEPTEKVRKDFKFLLDQIATDLKSWIIFNKDTKDSPLAILSYKTDDVNYFTMDSVLAYKMYLHETNLGALLKLPIFNLTANHKQVEEVIMEVLGMSYHEFQGVEYNECYIASPIYDKKCARFLDEAPRVMSWLANFNEVNPTQPFGSLLAAFSRSLKSISFDVGKLIKRLPNEKLCQEIKNKNEMFMQNYFSSLSKPFALTENETVSLFDLPTIFGNLGKVTLENEDFPTVDQYFLYSMCQIDKDWTYLDESRCKDKMMIYAADPRGRGHHPCDPGQGKNESFGIKSCCNIWTNKISHNLKPIMNVMRFAGGRGKSHYDLWNVINRFNETFEYPIIHGDFSTIGAPYLAQMTQKRDLTTMIPWCQLNQHGKSTFGSYEYECNHFDPVATDMNICHSFNPIQTPMMLRSSHFTESFMDAFGTDLPKEARNFTGKGSGKDYALDFYLMDNNFWRKANPRKTSFVMGLSSKFGYFDMKSFGQTIKTGYHTIWKVQAMEILPSEDLRDIAIDKRDCKFPDETSDLKIFKVYSQSACEYECRIKRGFELCRCYPWFVPMPPQEEKSPICDLYGNYCFEKIINSDNTWGNCSCLPSCHQVEFTYNEELNHLDPNEVCNDAVGRRTVEMNIARRITNNGYNSLVYRYYKFKNWFPYTSTNDTLGYEEAWDLFANQKKLCEFMVKNQMAKVSVMFERKKYVRTLTNLKVTFTDKLAAFGETLEFLFGTRCSFQIFFISRWDPWSVYWNEYLEHV